MKELIEILVPCRTRLHVLFTCILVNPQNLTFLHVRFVVSCDAHDISPVLPAFMFELAKGIMCQNFMGHTHLTSSEPVRLAQLARLWSRMFGGC